jgi:hypothetical protein
MAIYSQNLPRRAMNPAFLKKTSENSLAQDFRFFLLFTILHVPFGISLYFANILTLIHPLVVFTLGIYFAFKSEVKIERVVYVCAYIVGTEVLWRMTGSPIFWEFSKYSISVIMLLALVRRREMLRFAPLTIFYFALLIPACIITLLANDLSVARGKLSANMSGPIALWVCCLFFGSIKFDSIQFRRTLLYLAAPVVSIACATLFFTVTAEDIKFGTESNFATSGGFGPNQVSTALGLGAFALILCYFLQKNSRNFEIYCFVLITFMAAQSVLTFSRSGIYNTLIATLFVVLFQLGKAKILFKKGLPLVFLGVVFLLLIFPYLNNFTGGKLQERFEDTGTSNRTEIIYSDLEIWEDNPIFGVGVGEAQNYRERYISYSAASHTELSRLISEHGTFGILSLLLLFLMTVLNIKKQRLSIGKALTAGLVMWSFMYMVNSGMRLAAPSFIYGLSFIVLINSSSNIELMRRLKQIQLRQKLRRLVLKPAASPTV